MTTTPQQEREAIVAYLRRTVVEERAFNRLPLWRRYWALSKIGKSSPRLHLLEVCLAARFATAAKDWTADAIERGHHIPQTKG